MTAKKTSSDFSGDNLPLLERDYETEATPLDTQGDDTPFHIEWIEEEEEEGDNEFYNEMLTTGWFGQELVYPLSALFNFPNWDNPPTSYLDIFSEYFWEME